MEEHVPFLRDIFRGHKLIRLIEVVALLPATVLLGPVLLYGGIGMVFALIGVFFGPGKSYRGAILWPMFFLLGQMMVGVASLVFLWVLILTGMQVTKRQPSLRWVAITLLALGLAAAVHFLFGNGEVSANVRSSIGSVLLWTAMLGLPMLVGVRYIYLLLRR